MVKRVFVLVTIVWLGNISCAQNRDLVEPERVVINDEDENFGYYLKLLPKSKQADGLLVLFPGLGQKSEDIFLDTNLPQVASENNFLTIGFSGFMRITADSIVRERLNLVLKHVFENNEVASANVFLGGFSAGGVVALRYTELCYQFPNEYPVKPKAIFMADSPVDLYYCWNLKLEDMKNNRSEISVQEGKWMEKFYRLFYKATPSENPERYRDLSPFSIDTTYGTNEQYLKDVAVRAYHDIDVAWRINNRNQTARFDNYIATSELINRLVIMGNDRAQFIQSFQTGYRRNGERHPHSWSIINADECIDWIVKMMN